MKRQSLALIGSAAVHAALLTWLSVVIAALPVQISFQRGRASIDLQASIASAPPEETEITPKFEETRPVKVEPQREVVERKPVEPPRPVKPDAEQPQPDERESEPFKQPRPDTVAETTEVDIEPPPRRLAEAKPRDLESPTESVASAASRAESGVEHDEPPSPYPANRQPPYPADAYARRQQGSVVLHLEVLSDGTVGEVRIVRSSGVASLDAAALSAARGWRYTPARRGGVSIAMTFETRINFIIRG